MSTHASLGGDLAITSGAARFAEAMLSTESAAGSISLGGRGSTSEVYGADAPKSSPALLFETLSGGLPSSREGVLGGTPPTLRPPTVPPSVYRTLSDGVAGTKHLDSGGGGGDGSGIKASTSSSGSLNQLSVLVPDCINPLLLGKKILLLEPCMMIRQARVRTWVKGIGPWHPGTLQATGKVDTALILSKILKALQLMYPPL